MDYEKLYKEANKKVAVRFGSNVAKELFPDLYESENERIRKEMLDFFNGFYNNKMPKAVDVSPWIAWLEKQGEKGTNGNNGEISFLAWSEDDEENLNWFEKFFRAESVIAGGRDIPQDRYLWFKNLKDRVQPQPRQDWSEEDDEMLNLIIARLHSHPNIDLEEYSKEYDWLNYRLKSLSPQSTWKPSDEQMDVLLSEVTAWTKGCPKQIVLESLYNDLKKLKG